MTSLYDRSLRTDASGAGRVVVDGGGQWRGLRAFESVSSALGTFAAIMPRARAGRFWAGRGASESVLWLVGGGPQGGIVRGCKASKTFLGVGEVRHPATAKWTSPGRTHDDGFPEGRRGSRSLTGRHSELTLRAGFCRHRNLARRGPVRAVLHGGSGRSVRRPAVFLGRARRLWKQPASGLSWAAGT